MCGGESAAALQLDIDNQCFPLEKGNYYLIGQSNAIGKSPNYIQLGDKSLDMKHCLLDIRSSEDIFIVDLGSATGVHVNGKQLKPLTKEPVKPNDEFRLGDQLKAQIKCIGKHTNCSVGTLKYVPNTNESMAESITMAKQVLTCKPSNDNKVQQVHCVENNNLPANHNDFRLSEAPFCPSKSRSATSDEANNSNNSNLNQISVNADKEVENYFFMPETQEASAKDSGSDMAESVNDNAITGNEFKISSQEFNDENKTEVSQIVPTTDHNMTLLSKSGGTLQQLQGPKGEAREMTPPAGRSYNQELSRTSFRAATTTPDIFDFSESNEPIQEERDEINNDTSNDVTGQEEDLVPTQLFPTRAVLKNKLQSQTLENGETEANESMLTLRGTLTTYPANEAQSKSIMMITSATNVHDNAERFIKPPTSSSSATRTALISTLVKDETERKNLAEPFKDTERDKLQASRLETFKKPLTEGTSAKGNTSMLDRNSIDESSLELHMRKEHINISGLEAKNTAVFAINGESDKDEENGTSALSKQSAEKTANKGITSVAKTGMQEVPMRRSPRAGTCNWELQSSSDRQKDIPSPTISTSMVDSDVHVLMCTPQLVRESIDIFGLELPYNSTESDYVFDINGEGEKDDENGLIRLIKKKSKPNEDFERLLAHLKGTSPRAKRFKTSGEAKGFQDNIQNLSKDVREGKKISRYNEVIAEGHQNSNNDKSSKELERSQQVASKSGTSVANTARQEVPMRRLTRPRTREWELEKASPKLAIVESESSTTTRSIPTVELSSKRSTRSSLQVRELRRSPASSKKAINASSSVLEKKRKTRLSLQLQIGDGSDHSPKQPSRRIIETRAPSKQNQDPTSPGQETILRNELKRKGPDGHSSRPSVKGSKKMSAEEEAYIPSTSALSKRCLQISTTMVDKNLLKELIRNSKGQWTLADDPLNSELLIMDKGVRTYKFLLAMAKGIPIVTTQWIQQVNETRSLKPFKNYFFSDPVFEKKYKFSLADSLNMTKKNSLFAGYGFFVTSNVKPQPREMETIIECAGGHVHNEYDRVNQEQQEKLYLVSCLDDKKGWRAFRQRYKCITIIPSEAIMSAVVRQDINFLNKFVLN
uniref:Mediator of DNA damage checkpoint protein 1 n=1 Tax=Glossina pallidipes TaxID=7398 RepID=A0A1B0A1N5_GLOPL